MSESQDVWDRKDFRGPTAQPLQSVGEETEQEGRKWLAQSHPDVLPKKGLEAPAFLYSISFWEHGLGRSNHSLQCLRSPSILFRAIGKPRVNLAAAFPQKSQVMAGTVTSVIGPSALPQHPHTLPCPQSVALTLHLSPQNLRVKPEWEKATITGCPHTTLPAHNLWVMIPFARSPAPEIVWCIGRGPGANRHGSIVSYDPI